MAVSVALLAAVSGTAAQVLPADTLIQLQRTSCYGTCPIYRVTIDAHGTATWIGEMFVRVVGPQTARIDPSQVAALLAHAERIRFFDMRDEYRVIENPDGTVTSVTDLPTTIVTITVNGRTKRVENYLGAPDDLAAFERAIDEAARTKQWVFLDEDALETLRRAGWSASGDEGMSLLKQAIERDEVAIAHTLIQMGANLDGPPKNGLPPLLSVRSGPMVDLLVGAGADPNERAVGGGRSHTPLMTTAYKDAGTAEALLRAGARVDDLDDYGHTALFFTACAGNWRVLDVLLRAGADPRRGATNISALECTRRGRIDEMSRRARPGLNRGRPTVDDFDRVITLLEEAEKSANR